MPCPRRCAGAYRATVGGQCADARFFMNRQQVGKRQRPIKLFLGCAQFLGVLNDGKEVVIP